ncbi:uncharacterized protein OCT59_012642 [Rhizophagus irregularis]|uniref:Uncharacterized protein n=1 Tax=Rhizophagus irregularis (strain DAOM 197198w) TaxID=1432141 RepID=A0A015MJ67_RHIIW|nr:hypothetical protein RirG_119320 [Rhizophagus irregularis DAOM 197198w]UZO20216.1 hypothetical protein OCT59_012642 [Rhizophagus irregularis]
MEDSFAKSGDIVIDKYQKNLLNEAVKVIKEGEVIALPSKADVDASNNCNATMGKWKKKTKKRYIYWSLR